MGNPSVILDGRQSVKKYIQAICAYRNGGYNMGSIHLLLADDHAFYREGIRILLRTEPDIEVIGEAATGEEVIVRAQVLQLDASLMDIKIPALNGIEATRQILRVKP